jgi:hypothetical protein
MKPNVTSRAPRTLATIPPIALRDRDDRLDDSVMLILELEAAVIDVSIVCEEVVWGEIDE